jgi:hypothetical protein
MNLPLTQVEKRAAQIAGLLDRLPPPRLASLWGRAADFIKTDRLDPATMAQILERQCFFTQVSFKKVGGRQIRTYRSDVVEIPIQFAWQIAAHLRTSRKKDRRQTLQEKQSFDLLIEKAKRKKEKLREKNKEMSATAAEREAAEWAAEGTNYSVETIRRAMQRKGA